jgi:hypothetical protein
MWGKGKVSETRSGSRSPRFAQLGLRKTELLSRQAVLAHQRAAEHRRIVGIQNDRHSRHRIIGAPGDPRRASPPSDQVA